MRVVRLVRFVLALGALVSGVYVLLWRGALTIDIGIGRRVRPLGPIRVPIDAPRDIVFDVVSSPYLGRTPVAMQEKLRVLERGTDVVLADHRTQVGPITTSTVEVVTFDAPTQVRFRLVRGPVPHVTEAFDLDEQDGRCVLTYTGEIGADLWALGTWWSNKVAGYWEATVQRSLGDVKSEAERRARRR